MAFHFTPPLRDIDFVLHDVLEADAMTRRLPGYEAWEPAVVRQTLDEVARFAVRELLPLRVTGDREGCTLDDRGVRVPAGFGEAWQRFALAGWAAMSAGGEPAVPSAVQLAAYEILTACNPAWAMIAGTTRGACRLLRAHASADLQARYLSRLASGEWTATMALTEPQCGSDLGLLRTRAVPLGDGRYRLNGQKIFITGGDHDMTANIVHLVLARLPDAPAGVAGISLFLVPKLLPGQDGVHRVANSVSVTAVEHKMGLCGSPTCAVAFDGAVGWLVGEPHRGLAAMFVMVNSARVAIGAQAAGMGQAAHDSAVSYARERLQMRSARGTRRPDLPADPIIEHADVRRLLLTQKAIVEASRLLVLWLAVELDVEAFDPDPLRRQQASETVSLFTPVAKAFLAEGASRVADIAIQVHGGHGYIRDTGVEQIVRDARVAQIYDGTTAIQARDLLARKVLPDGGRALGRFLGAVRRSVADAPAAVATPIGALCDEVAELTEHIAREVRADADAVGAAGSDYLRVLGHLACGHLFARARAVSQGRINAGETDPFHAAKVATADFYFGRLLPEAFHHARLARVGTASLSSLPQEVLFG